MLWMYHSRIPKTIPREYFDPKHEGRYGRVLSQKAYNLVRKKQLEYLFAHQHKHKLATLLSPKNYPELEWPVLIGNKHNATVLLTDQEIGSGSYGKVIFGFCLDTAKLVCIKIQPNRESEPLRVKEAKAEIKNTKKLNTLIDYYYANVEDELCSFLVQDYAYGVDIFHVLYQNNTKITLSLKDQLSLAIGIAEAFYRFYKKGFVHRDLSLGNVVWDAEAKRAELIDFAKMVHLDNRKGMWCEPDGGLRFLAPELTHLNSRGKAYYSAKSDIYALGIIFCDIFSKYDITFNSMAQIAQYSSLKNHTGLPKLLVQAAPDLFSQTSHSSEHFQKICELIKLMIEGDLQKRPSAKKILYCLNSIQREILKAPDKLVKKRNKGY